MLPKAGVTAPTIVTGGHMELQRIPCKPKQKQGQPTNHHGKPLKLLEPPSDAYEITWSTIGGEPGGQLVVGGALGIEKLHEGCAQSDEGERRSAGKDRGRIVNDNTKHQIAIQNR